MIEADLLSGELGGRPPHIRVPESLAPIAVDRVAHHADVGILLHDHRIRHVLPHDDRAVQVAPLPADVRDHLRVELRELDRRIHGEPAAVRLRERDVRGPLVQADPREMQFVREDLDMGLEHIDHQQEEITSPGDRQDLLAAPAALRCAPDEPGHVEHLDLRPAVLHEARDDVQRREVVRGDLARRIRDLIEERRLSDAREADEPDRRVPALLDRVARTAAAPLEAPRLLFVLEPRQLRLQPPDVVLGRLVVRRLLDLVLDRLDLFLDGHAMRNRAGRTTKNLSTPALRGLLESDLVPLRVPEGRDSTEALGSNRCHVDPPAREFSDRGLAVLDQELHVPAVALGMRFAFRMEGDGTTPCTEVREVRVLVRNRQAERFVIERAHPVEIADPEEYRFELRIGQGTGDRFRHRVTTRTWGHDEKSVFPYHTVRMPSGSRPLTAYRTNRHERAVYGDKSRPPSTRWTNRPAASNISLSSARVYARTDAVNSRVPFLSMMI